MIKFELYIYAFVFFFSGVCFYFIYDYIKASKLFIKESYFKRICKLCNVTQVLANEDGFTYWKKTAKSNCDCSNYISYFLK